MYSIPGIKQIGRCNLGTLATVPAGVYLAGIRDKATMTFKSYKTTKDVKGRPTRNMLQANLEFESLQPTMKDLKSLFDHINLNCDIQMMTEKQNASADSEDVYKFNASSFLLGLGFEHLITMERRSLKQTYKGAADYAVVKTLIDGADTAIAAALGAGQIGGEDWSLQRRIIIEALQSPSAVDLLSIAGGELDDFKLSMKANTVENALGQILIDWIAFQIDITINNASVDKAVAQLAKDQGAALLLKLTNDTGFYDAFDFNTGALTCDFTKSIEEKRQLVLSYQGQIRPYECSFLFGAGNGGDVGDTVGLKGGTLKVGY